MTPSPDPDPALFRELQHLRSRVGALEVENADLKERLAFAWSEVEHVRAQLAKRPLQAAESVERSHGALVPVTAPELADVLGRLRGVQPLPLV